MCVKRDGGDAARRRGPRAACGVPCQCCTLSRGRGARRWGGARGLRGRRARWGRGRRRPCRRYWRALATGGAGGMRSAVDSVRWSLGTPMTSRAEIAEFHHPSSPIFTPRRRPLSFVNAPIGIIFQDLISAPNSCFPLSQDRQWFASCRHQ